MNRSIITQTAVQPVQFLLNEVGANLAAHANATLSQGHGVNMVPGVNYLDDHGDTIGTSVVVFTIGDAVYFAPCVTTALDGQPPSTGQPAVIAAASVLGEQSNAWTTDFVTQDLANVQTLNEQVLLAHALEGYWEAHGTMVAIEKPTLDSIGHQIGTYVIQLSFNGIVYEIPCHTQIGGFTLTAPPAFQGFDQPSPKKVQSPSTPYNFVINPEVIGGTPPITYAYEYGLANSLVSSNFDGNTITPDTDTTVSFITRGNALTVNYSSTTGRMTFKKGSPGGGNYSAIFVRLTGSNAYGSTHNDVNGNPMVFNFGVQDTGS